MKETANSLARDTIKNYSRIVTETCPPNPYAEITIEEWLTSLEEQLEYLIEEGVISKDQPYPEIKTKQDIIRFENLMRFVQSLRTPIDQIEKLSFSLSRRCRNICDFCGTGAHPEGEVVEFSKLKNIDSRLIQLGRRIEFAGNGESLYYENAGNGIADVIDSFYQKGARDFSFLTAGIYPEDIRNPFIKEQIFKLANFFHINTDATLSVLISFHNNFHLQDEDFATIQYALILQMLSLIPRIKIKIKQLIHGFDKENELQILQNIRKRIAESASKGSFKILETGDEEFLINDTNIRVKKEPNYIDYRISWRKKPTPPSTEKKAVTPMQDISISHCDALYQDSYVIVENGDIYPCGDLNFHLSLGCIKSTTNIYSSPFEKYFGEIMNERQRVQSYVKRNLSRIVHQGWRPMYCQGLGKLKPSK